MSRHDRSRQDRTQYDPVRDDRGVHDRGPDERRLDDPERRDRELQRQIGRREQSDAWGAFSLLLSGLLVYGGLGWLAAHFTGLHWLLGVGIVLGAAGGLLAVWLRYGKA